MVPSVVLPPTVPFTDQVRLRPAKEGVNCCGEPARTETVLGESVSVCGPGGDDGVSEQLGRNITSNKAASAGKGERRTMSLSCESGLS